MRSGFMLGLEGNEGRFVFVSRKLGGTSSLTRRILFMLLFQSVAYVVRVNAVEVIVGIPAMDK